MTTVNVISNCSLFLSPERYKSENFGDGTSDKPGSSLTRRDRSNFTSVGSAEALHQGSTPGNDSPAQQQKKILSFNNPFDPNKIHSEAPAFRRRWVHVFPTNKRGVAFQTHHQTEGDPRNSNPAAEGDPSSWVSKLKSGSGTPQTPAQRRGILKQSSAASPGEGGGSQSGSFRSEKGLGRTKGSPSSLSPGEGQRARKRGLLSKNGSSVTNRGSPVSEPDSQALTPSSSRPTSAANTPDLLRRQRWAEPSLPSSSTADNFSSVRRTGVDWISLVKPAHLPVTTDFYPAKEILDRDYAQYNSSLIVFREEQDMPRETTGSSGSEKR